MDPIFLFLKYIKISVNTIDPFRIYKKIILLRVPVILKSVPLIYPVKSMSRKNRLLPLFVLDLHDLIIDKGHARPKHISIPASKIVLIIFSVCLNIIKK